MSLWISIIGFWILLLVCIYIFKDYLHPAVLFCIPWCIFLTLLIRTDFTYNGSSTAYFYFLLGGVVFVVGTIAANRSIHRNERLETQTETYYPNYTLLKILVFAEAVFTVYTLISFYRFIGSHYLTNVFLSYYVNRAEFGADGIINYGRNIVTAAAVSMIIGYSHVREDEKKRYRIFLTIEIVFYLVLSITKMTRNGILSSILPVLIAVIIVSKAKNRTVLKWGIIGGIGLIILFSVVSILKSPYLFEGKNYIDVLLDQFSLYGTGGFVAFQTQFDTGLFPHTNGGNTFRTFLAIFDAVFGTDNAPPLIQGSTFIGHNIATNVYTFYHWYVSDFGLLYALVVQCLIGFFHGKIYKAMAQYRMFGFYLYCIMLYPLFMQIFQDQYFSLLSNWIQQFVYGALLLKTSILFMHSPSDRGKLLWYVRD